MTSVYVLSLNELVGDETSWFPHSIHATEKRAYAALERGLAIGRLIRGDACGRSYFWVGRGDRTFQVADSVVEVYPVEGSNNPPLPRKPNMLSGSLRTRNMSLVSKAIMSRKVVRRKL
jgi:hypothetical protein